MYLIGWLWLVDGVPGKKRIAKLQGPASTHSTVNQHASLFDHKYPLVSSQDHIRFIYVLIVTLWVMCIRHLERSEYCRAGVRLRWGLGSRTGLSLESYTALNTLQTHLSSGSLYRWGHVLIVGRFPLYNEAKLMLRLWLVFPDAQVLNKPYNTIIDLSNRDRWLCMSRMWSLCWLGTNRASGHLIGSTEMQLKSSKPSSHKASPASLNSSPK